MFFSGRELVIFLAAMVCATPVCAKNYRVTAAPAEVDRAGMVVVFGLPADAPRRPVLQAGDTRLLVQVEGNAATFVVPFQKAGEALTWMLRETDRALVSDRGVETQKQDGRLRVLVGGAPAFEFRMDRDAVPRPDIKPEFKRAGYIHPVFSPAGKIVTDDYPSNHVHHHGIWTPWTKTKFQGRSPDFWNMGAKTGAEEFVALQRTGSGPVMGGFVAQLKMIDLSAPTPVTALNETWTVTAYDVTTTPGPPVRMFDLAVKQECATGDPLVLPKYHYGGFGFRGATEWNGPGEAALFLTAEGVTDRIAGNDTRGRWCYLGGKLDGGIAGTAILGHPENFRAPQTMRLHPNMPYMSFVPQQLGDFAIEPGRPYTARFRFIVADGAPDRARIDAYWHGYAQPAVVRLESEK